MTAAVSPGPPAGVSVLTRPGADVAWLRWRLTSSEDTPARRLAQAFLLRAALPELPVDGMPLHTVLTELGALFSVTADGHGLAVYVTVVPERLAAAAAVIGAAIGTPMPDDLARDAATEVAADWQWAGADSESLADLIAGLALHTPPDRWAGLHDELAAAMSDPPPPGAPWARPSHATVVSPYPLAGPVIETLAGDRLGRPAGPIGSARAEPVTLRLSVASESSALIRLAWRTPPRTDADFPALAVAARVLGGHYRSRLMRAFRQEHGWSYSPWAMLRSAPAQGLWQACVRVPAAHVGDATTRIAELMAEPATPAERAAAVAHTIAEQRTLWSSGESRLTLSGYWQDLGLQPEEERQQWPRRLGEVTADSLQDVVRRHLSRPPDLTTVLT